MLSCSLVNSNKNVKLHKPNRKKATLLVQLTATIKDMCLLCKQLSWTETDNQFWTKPQWYDRSILLMSFTQKLMQTPTCNDVRYAAFSTTVICTQ